MHAPVIDTLKAAEDLTASGMPPPQAAATVQLIATAVAERDAALARRCDVEAAQLALRADIKAGDDALRVDLRNTEERLRGELRTTEERLRGDIRVIAAGLGWVRWMLGGMLGTMAALIAALMPLVLKAWA